MTHTAGSFEVHQEEDVIATTYVLAAAGAWCALGAGGVLLAVLVLISSVGSMRPSAAGPDGPQPAPRTISGVEQTPILDAKAGIELRSRQRAQLEAWGWVDRDAGIARIPIEQAMDLVVSGEQP